MSRKDFIAGYMAGRKAMRKRATSDNYDQYQDKLLNITPEQVERAEFVDEYDRMLDDGFEPDEIIYSYGDNLTAEIGNWALTVEKTLGGSYKWAVIYWCDEVASGMAYSESDACTLAVGSLYNAVVDAHSRSASRKAVRKSASRLIDGKVGDFDIWLYEGNNGDICVAWDNPIEPWLGTPGYKAIDIANHFGELYVDYGAGIKIDGDTMREIRLWVKDALHEIGAATYI